MSERGTTSHPVVALMAGRYELVRELDAGNEVRRWEAFDTALQRSVLLEFLPHDLVGNPEVVDRFWRSARSSARTNTDVGNRVLDAGTDAETGRAFVVREWSSPRAKDAPTGERTIRQHAPKPPVAAPPRARGRSGSLKLALAGLAVVATVGVLALRPGVEGWLAWIDEPFGKSTPQFSLGPVPQPATTVAPAATVTAAVKPTTAASTPTSAAPTPVRTPTAAAGVTRRIVNTDGRGVALRGSPGGDRLPGKGYDEGATVQAFESNGEWTRIQGNDGRQGWVLSVTLSR